jgi:hypothetical protein
VKLRDLIDDARAYVGGLAIALAGRAAMDGAAYRPAANVQVDRLRSTLAACLGFEDIPPDEQLEAALRHRLARIGELEQRWRTCAARVRVLGEHNVRLAFEADGLRRSYTALADQRGELARQLAEREHQLLVARRMLRNGDVDGAGHYLWEVTEGLAEGGGLEHPGSLPGEEVGDVG